MARTACNAIDNPVTKAPVPMSEKEIGQQETRTLESMNEIKVIEKVSDQPFDSEKMQMLQFMNEPVTIRIATSTDKNAEQCFELNINGRAEFFRRGETKTVKRNYVDLLMRLKQTVYGQDMVINKEGIKSYVYPASTGLKYDFAIIRDDNPLGKSWERAVLAERG
jgi:hypothetical protein